MPDAIFAAHAAAKGQALVSRQSGPEGSGSQHGMSSDIDATCGVATPSCCAAASRSTVPPATARAWAGAESAPTISPSTAKAVSVRAMADQIDIRSHDPTERRLRLAPIASGRRQARRIQVRGGEPESYTRRCDMPH